MTYDSSEPRRLDPRYKIERYVPYWRPIPAPDADPDRPPFVCLRLNRHWLPVVVGALDPATFEDAYIGDNATQQLASLRAHTLIALFAAANECGVEPMLRQNPQNPCQLEQSLDGGLTWSLAFDYSLCGPQGGIQSVGDIEVVNNIIVDVNVLIQQLLQDYQGDPDNIAPDLPYDMTPTDDQRDAAHCGAAYLFVRAAAEALLELKRAQDEQNDSIIDIVANAVAVLGGLAIAWYAGADAGAKAQRIIRAVAFVVISTVAGQIVSALDEPTLTSEDVRREVACCLTNALQGATVTQAAFENAFDSPCDFVDPRAADFVEWLQPIMQETDTYLLYLDALQTSFDTLETGAELPCDCDEWTLTFTLDDEAADGLEIESGTVAFGTAVTTEDYDGGGCWYRQIRLIGRFANEVQINRITILTNYTRGQRDCNPTARGWRLYTDDWQTQFLVFNDDIENTDGAEAVTKNIDITTSEIRTHLICSARGSQAGLGGSAAIAELTISGTGPQPIVVPPA